MPVSVLLACLTCGHVASESECYNPRTDELQCPDCGSDDLTDSDSED